MPEITSDPEPYVWADGSRSSQEYIDANREALLYVEHHPRTEDELIRDGVIVRDYHAYCVRCGGFCDHYVTGQLDALGCDNCGRTGK